MRELFFVILFAVLGCGVPSGSTLVLKKALHLPGSFTVAGQIWADEARVYAATFEGDLFVIDRATHRVLSETHVSDFPLSAVRGSDGLLFVTTAEGTLVVLIAGEAPKVVEEVRLSESRLSGVTVRGNFLYVGVGQVAFTMNTVTLFVAQLNENDKVVEIPIATLAPLRTYGEEYAPFQIQVLERFTGRRRGLISNPLDVFGRPTHVALASDDDFLAVTVAGCCGPGLFVYDALDLSFFGGHLRAFTNVAVKKGRSLWVVTGTESGRAELFHGSTLPFEGDSWSPVSSVDVAGLTGFTGPEEVEIRSIWTDDTDGQVFCGSSWTGRRPELPSLFVLEVVSGQRG